MRQILFILFGISITAAASAQSLKKYPISTSGCSAYFFCEPGKFTLEKSPDSSDVYTGECTNNDVSYGTICVKLKDKMADLTEAEDVLVMYLDYLKTSFAVKDAAGYGKGHRLKNKETTRGIIDYWTDKDGVQFKVKGWTDGKYIAVMYVYSKNEVPETKANVFLDGLVLPGI